MNSGPLPWTPCGAVRRDHAAKFCGLSATTFDAMVRDGVLPQPRLLGERIKVWLIADLEAALASLPPAGGDSEGNTCDAAFGIR
ncbi:MAG: hypothetical protein AAF192_11930 [Pseudomonadota bacterium]